MAEKDKVKEVSDLATKAVEAVAKSLGVATVELWKIFVRQYIVKGLANVFVAIVLYVAAYLLWGAIGLFALIPISIATTIVYMAIPYIGNPQYYAIEDITTRVKDFLSKTAE